MQTRLARGALGLGLLLAGSTVCAVPIHPDLTITGSATLAPSAGIAFSASSSDGNVTQTGDLRKIVGGTTTSSGFTTTPGTADGVNDNSTTIPAALSDTFTDTGDGVGFTTDLDAGFAAGSLSPFTDGFNFRVDLGFNLANNAANFIFTVTMKVDFSGAVDSDGNDAFAEVELDVEVNGTDVAAGQRDLESDTLLGDFKNGTPQGTFGAPISDAGIFFFDVILNPSATTNVNALSTWKGAVFEPGLASADYRVDMTIAEISCITVTGGPCVQQPPPPNGRVPEPGILALLGLGLGGLAATRRRQRQH